MRQSDGDRYSPSDELTCVCVDYRWMTVDRDDHEFLCEVQQQGVMAGVTLRF